MKPAPGLIYPRASSLKNLLKCELSGYFHSHLLDHFPLCALCRFSALQNASHSLCCHSLYDLLFYSVAKFGIV